MATIQCQPMLSPAPVRDTLHAAQRGRRGQMGWMGGILGWWEEPRRGFKICGAPLHYILNLMSGQKVWNGDSQLCASKLAGTDLSSSIDGSVTLPGERWQMSLPFRRSQWLPGTHRLQQQTFWHCYPSGCQTVQDWTNVLRPLTLTFLHSLLFLLLVTLVLIYIECMFLRAGTFHSMYAMYNHHHCPHHHHSLSWAGYNLQFEPIQDPGNHRNTFILLIFIAFWSWEQCNNFRIHWEISVGKGKAISKI